MVRAHGITRTTIAIGVMRSLHKLLQYILVYLCTYLCRNLLGSRMGNECPKPCYVRTQRRCAFNLVRKILIVKCGLVNVNPLRSLGGKIFIFEGANEYCICIIYLYYLYILYLCCRITTAGKIRTRVAQQHCALLFACHHAGCRENTHIRFSMSHFCPAFLWLIIQRKRIQDISVEFHLDITGGNICLILSACLVELKKSTWHRNTIYIIKVVRNLIFKVKYYTPKNLYLASWKVVHTFIMKFRR